MGRQRTTGRPAPPQAADSAAARPGRHRPGALGGEKWGIEMVRAGCNKRLNRGLLSCRQGIAASGSEDVLFGTTCRHNEQNGWNAASASAREAARESWPRSRTGGPRRG